jgi:pimeloyl-ACP methyl ester carboxylesterase
MRPDFATLSTVEIAESLLALIEEIGPAVLIAHSAGGPMAWWIAERRPDKIRAIVGVAPGAPANLLPDLPDDTEAIYALRNDRSLGCPVCVPEDRPVWVDPAFVEAYWANAPRFPRSALGRDSSAAGACGQAMPSRSRRQGPGSNQTSRCAVRPLFS